MQDMKRALFFSVAAVTFAGAAGVMAGPAHFAVTAVFEPPARGKTEGAIAVTFSPSDPDIHVDEQPVPRLALDHAQTVLLDRQPPPPKMMPVDPNESKYIDASQPVRFA